MQGGKDDGFKRNLDHLCGPVRRQLLGAQPGGSGNTFSPAAADVPLAALADSLGLLRSPDARGSDIDIGGDAAGGDGLAAENARLRAENARLRQLAKM